VSVFRLVLPTLAFLCVVPRTRAQMLETPTFVPKTSDTRLRFWALDAGARATWALDTSTLAAHSSFGASRTVAMWFPITVALGARWDTGAAKRDDAFVPSQRVVGALDVRWHARSRGAFGFVRLGVGIAGDRVGTGLAADASLGLAVSFAEMDDDPTEHLPRFWLSPELGFSYTRGATGLGGPFTRLVATMSF